MAVRTGTFPSPPPHSLDSFFGMYRHHTTWELIKKGAGTEWGSLLHDAWEGGIDEMSVNIRLITSPE